MATNNICHITIARAINIDTHGFVWCYSNDQLSILPVTTCLIDVSRMMLRRLTIVKCLQIEADKQTCYRRPPSSNLKLRRKLSRETWLPFQRFYWWWSDWINWLQLHINIGASCCKAKRNLPFVPQYLSAVENGFFFLFLIPSGQDWFVCVMLIIDQLITEVYL